MDSIKSTIEFIKSIVPVAAVAIVAYFADDAGGGIMKDVWAALKTASPPVAMLTFILFIQEKKERQEAQRQCNERTIDFIKATNEATNAFEQIADGLRRRTR